MIKGIGSDLVRIPRIARTMQRFETFPARWFTDVEQKLAKRRKNPEVFFAGRFAAKEAIAKALGSGMGQSAHWVEISVDADESGRPVATLSGVTHHTALSLCDHKPYRVHITVSHEQDYALAFAVIEKVV